MRVIAEARRREPGCAEETVGHIPVRLSQNAAIPWALVSPCTLPILNFDRSSGGAASVVVASSAAVGCGRPALDENQGVRAFSDPLPARTIGHPGNVRKMRKTARARGGLRRMACCITLGAMERPNRTARNGISRRHGVALVLAAPLVAPFAAAPGRADDAMVRVGYIRSLARHPTISLLDQPAPDVGLAGATLAMDDNNTTGRLEGQNFELIDVPVRKGADLAAALDELASKGVKLAMTDLPADVAAYKGQRLTLRDWDLQLRQPIMLADGRTIVSISPQPGFLHQVTQLDTLGIDRPETKCTLR
jgi:hypothetical protein